MSVPVLATDNIVEEPLRPRLPGVRPISERITACLIEARLEGFGIHTSRHFAGMLRTHTFFSRRALHSALWDLWAPENPMEPEPIEIPYGSTPLWADNPAIVEIAYGGPYGNLHVTKRNPSHPSVGIMEAMPPGTVLRAALWGDPAKLPPIFEGRVFYIGKGRAAVRVVRCVVDDVSLRSGMLGEPSLPIQVSTEALRKGVLKGVAYRILAMAPTYVVARIASTSRVPHVEIEGFRIPILEGLE